MQLPAIALMGFFATSPALAKDLFERFPQDSSVTLESGVEVALPLHFRASTTWMFVGTGDADLIRAAVVPLGLFPVLKSSARAYANLLLVDHRDTSIGGYQEAILAVPVRTTAKSKLLPNALDGLLSFLSVYFGGASEKYGIFIWKVLVNTPIALDAGREIWGIPKWMADFTLTPTGFRAEDGGAVEASWTALPTKRFPLREIDYYAYATAGEITSKTRCVAIGNGTTSSKLREGTGGLSFQGDGPLTGTLAAIGFLADQVVYTPRQETVFLAPQPW